MKKKLLLVVLMISTVTLTACGATGATIVVNGSTSEEELFVKTLAPQVENDLGFQIDYQSTGSSSGIESATKHTANFGTSSRDLTADEAKNLDQLVLAYDGIAVITAKENKVQDLTQEQLTKIFTGEITNWSEVGGSDAEISVVSRESGSGTRTAFEELLGIEDKVTSSAQVSDGNGNVASTVAGNANAIGYVSFSTLIENEDTVNGVKINGFEPTPKNVLDKNYILSRPFLLLYQKDKLTAEDQKFLDWINETGKTLVTEAGLIEA